MKPTFALALLVSVFVSVQGCTCSDDDKGTDARPSRTSPPVVDTTSKAGAPAAPTPPPATLTGATIARAPDGSRLYVADETNRMLHIVPLPLPTSEKAVTSVALPGPPGQLVVTHDRLWLTIRNPSMLWFAQIEGGKVREVGRVPLPDDAWGLSITSDLERALVTSAWSARVSLVDIAEKTKVWSHPVSREPRSAVIAKDGSFALVSHLVGSHITRVALEEDSPEVTSPNHSPSNPPTAHRNTRVRPIALAAAPLRSPGRSLPASLGYSGVMAPDEGRYFVARHALGALGKRAWFGAASVDVLRLDTWEGLAPEKPQQPLEEKSELASQLISGGDTAFPGSSLAAIVQPRAMVYRTTTQTLLVAGEGNDLITEFDALALDPTMAVVERYPVGADYHPVFHVAQHCAAPSGLALSRDERTLWVHCVATHDLAEVRLRDPEGASDPVAPKVTARLRLAHEPLGPGSTTGRKLFFSALDFPTSGGLGCAGCHPEGRDDGHTWHEASFTTEDGHTTNFVGASENVPRGAHSQGYARRTPMLAGRVYADGPYGWHGESEDITTRELAGFALHRWGAVPDVPPEQLKTRARALFDFLRRGLVAPARHQGPLTPLERQGRELFMSNEVGCSECHPPPHYTTRKVYPLPLLPLRPGYDEDPNASYKIPALTFLANRAPYFHDGSAESLAWLIDHNGNRMGRTAHLSTDERVALIAFLETL